MRLIPWNREPDTVGTLRREMNRLFEDFWPADEPRSWLPAIDVSETEAEVIVRAEIPGVDPKEVAISVHGDTLRIQGEKTESKEEKERHWHRVERRYGAFARTIQLPCTVDTEKAVADADAGVLTITLAKRHEEKTRKIDVRVK